MNTKVNELSFKNTSVFVPEQVLSKLNGYTLALLEYFKNKESVTENDIKEFYKNYILRFEYLINIININDNNPINIIHFINYQYDLFNTICMRTNLECYSKLANALSNKLKTIIQYVQNICIEYNTLIISLYTFMCKISYGLFNLNNTLSVDYPLYDKINWITYLIYLSNYYENIIASFHNNIIKYNMDLIDTFKSCATVLKEQVVSMNCLINNICSKKLDECAFEVDLKNILKTMLIYFSQYSPTPLEEHCEKKITVNAAASQASHPPSTKRK